jgi:hypothetical protein
MNHPQGLMVNFKFLVWSLFFACGFRQQHQIFFPQSTWISLPNGKLILD